MIRLGNLVKRTIGITMSALLTISMMPVQAYALDPLLVRVTEDEITVNGDEADSPIDRSKEDFGAVVVINGPGEQAGGDVEVNVANVQSEEPCGIGVLNGESSGNTTITSGNIETTEVGILVFSSGGETNVTSGNIKVTDGVGMLVRSADGEVNVTSGSIDATQQGIAVISPEAGAPEAETNIEVNGDINSKKDAVATYVIGGETNIKVNGNITGGEGVNEKFYPYDGICIESKDGTSNMEVAGDVSGSMGVYVETYDSETNLTINGNVTGTGKNISPIPGVGIIYNYYTDGETAEGNDKLNMLVTDTVSGGASGVGVVTKDDGSGFKLTTWKITPSTNEFVLGENIVAASLEDPSKPNNYKFVENEEFEKSIQYIVKIDQTEVAGVNSLGATKGDGSALDKEGKYEWAHEGDTVLLKVELQDGYELANAYGKENQSYPFTKDASGNYYITVPRGGGIFISVETALKPVDPAKPVNPVADVEVVDDEPSTDDPKTVQGMAINTVDPVKFNNSIIFMIANAVPGANITVASAGNTMISKEVVDTFMARPDVTLTITYVIDGVMYSVTIPAGVNLNAYRNAAGGIDIYTLVQVFGAIVVG